MLPLTSSQRAAQNDPIAAQRRREDRSIGIGILCTVLFHLLLIGIGPYLPVESLSGSHSNLDAIAAAERKDFNFELVDDTATPPQPVPFKFVETNPDAPENTPDNTPNFSNRNQQSAQQEKPPEIDPENRPSVKGRDDVQNDSAIVSGDMAQPQQGAAVTAVAQEMLEQINPQTAQQARAEQVPLSGTEKFEGDSPDGIGTNVSQSKSASNNADKFLEGAKDGKSATGALTDSPQVDPQQRPTPRPRPRLTQARPNVLQNRLSGTSNIGIMGIDARWSEYGEYMQEFIEIVQASWYAILQESRISPASGTRVVVTFSLTAQGEVSIISTEETAGKQGVYACTTAITTRQPYRKWTEQMIAVLGDRQTMTFSFYYW